MAEGWQGENWPSGEAPPPGAFAHALRVSGEAFIAQRDRWVLWLPIGLGLGIAAYFALPVEPEPWLGVAALALCGCAALAWRKRPLSRTV